MRADKIGLYVHIPFCVRKCAYCDFCSFPPDKYPDKSAYIDALCREILSYRDRHIAIDTIFFGGGTPSLLTPSEFDKIMSAIRDSFEIADGSEITMEVNPKTLRSEYLASYLRQGINRFSIGLQSIHENELKKLGRIHEYTDFLQTYELLRSHGVDNISVDLMYGIPDQTPESFAETLHTVCALSPEHISLYGLILEEGTPLFDMQDTLALPDEDAECDMYFFAAEYLSAHGYSHYEISNYAIPGRSSRHNLKYWHNEQYIGVGLSAYSYFDGVRFGNTKNMEEYLTADVHRSVDADAIDHDTEAYEYVMLALRLSEGVSLADYQERFGSDFLLSRRKKIDTLINLGYAEISDGRFFLTDKGMYISNSIITDII